MQWKPHFSAYNHPAGGWGSVQSLARSLTHEHVPVKGSRLLMHQNKPDGFACVSCAWAKPAKPRPFEFCEEGAKATTWEITGRRCTPEVFARYSVAELESWSDHDPECNPLVPVSYHAKGSFVPASKSIPVRLQRLGVAQAAI